MSSPLRRVLAVSGSLRAKSVNTAALLAMREITPPEWELALFGGVGGLPHFNPDLDTEAPPATVIAWRDAVQTADVLLLCTPEYAHGLPGSFKNALDWLVSFEGFVNKPVAVIAARPGGEHAQASLREILRVMNARPLDDASVTLPLTSNNHDAASLLSQAVVRERLQHCLARIAAALA